MPCSRLELGELSSKGSSSGHTLSCAIRRLIRIYPCLQHHPELASSNMYCEIYGEGLGIDVLSALAVENNIFSLLASFVGEVSHTIPS